MNLYILVKDENKINVDLKIIAAEVIFLNTFTFLGVYLVRLC